MEFVALVKAVAWPLVVAYAVFELVYRGKLKDILSVFADNFLKVGLEAKDLMKQIKFFIDNMEEIGKLHETLKSIQETITTISPKLDEIKKTAEIADRKITGVAEIQDEILDKNIVDTTATQDTKPQDTVISTKVLQDIGSIATPSAQHTPNDDVINAWGEFLDIMEKAFSDESPLDRRMVGQMALILAEQGKISRDNAEEIGKAFSFVKSARRLRNDSPMSREKADATIEQISKLKDLFVER